MIGIKTFFKILDKYGGYPNPRLQEICSISGYDCETLLEDMVNEFGYKKTKDIISEGLKSHFINKRLRLESTDIGEGYLEIIFESSQLKKNPNGPDLYLEYSYGDSEIPYLDPETEEENYKQIQDIISDDSYGGVEGDIEQYLMRPFFIKNYGFEPIFKIKY